MDKEGDFAEMSHKLMVRAGLLESAFDHSTFIQSTLKMHQWPHVPGELTKSHILNWQLSRKSFWKVFVPDREILEIALLVAADRFREVSQGNL